MRAATVVQQLCKSCRTCIYIYVLVHVLFYLRSLLNVEPTILLQNPSTMFNFEGKKRTVSENGRTKRYSHQRSEGLVRDFAQTTCDDACIDEQIGSHDIPPSHDTSLGTAAVKGGPRKLGEIHSFIHLFIQLGPICLWSRLK